MTHEDFEELAPLYALGALDGEDLSRFSGHLSGCTRCSRLVAEFEESSTALAEALPPMEPSPGLKGRILSGLAAAAPLAPTGSRARPWALVAAAALALLALTLGFLLMRAREDVKSLNEAMVHLHRDQDYLRDQNRSLLQDLDRRKGELETEEKKLKEALESLKTREGDVEKQKDEIARRGRQLQEHQAELARLARMDGLIRDLRTQIFELSGAPPAPKAQGRVFWRGEDILFNAADLPKLPEKKLYELWMLVPEAVPAGLYDAKGILVKNFTQIPPGNPKPTGFALTLEDEKGTTAPTEPLFLVPRKP